MPAAVFAGFSGSLTAERLHDARVTAQLLAPVIAAYNKAQTDAQVTFVGSYAQTSGPVAVVPLVRNAPKLYLGAGTARPVELSTLLRQFNWDAHDLVPGLLDACTWNGALLGVPYDFDPTAVLLNVADWRRLGATLPSDAWTEADFLAACTLLHAAPKRTAPVLRGEFPFFTDAQVWTAWVWGYGGALVDASGQVVLTDRGARDGIAALATAMRAARPDMCPVLVELPRGGAEAPGEMAFTDGGRFASAPRAGGTGLWPVPRMPVVPSVPTEVATLGINPKYPHPEVAAQFLVWLTSPAGQGEMVAAGYPTVLSAGPPGSGAWVGAFPVGFDHGGLTPAAKDLLAIPTQVSVCEDILSLAVWHSLGAGTPSALAAVLQTAEQECNAALALRGSAQTAYLQSHTKLFRFSIPPMPPGALYCYPPAIEQPSPYAPTVPPAVTSRPSTATGPPVPATSGAATSRHG